eukprot:TRINITY_DN1328_c0_g1_i1.p1 TRINITY_DN1328_c0_g1~~TRINITY_DN1328_c0_g1_i1.p1  ORF type:complete len:839 (+),score=134.17 TRINITY_DN1328_c0_g1_i1:212-2728(+)
MDEPAVTPKIFPGRLSKDNQGAIDWGRQNLIAFASHSYVVIVEPLGLQLVQTLDEHRSHVVCLRWSPECASNNADDCLPLQLASADKAGGILLWNVLDAAVVVSLQPPSEAPGPVNALEWLPSHTAAADSRLMSVHAGSLLVLWSLSQARPLWLLPLPASSAICGLSLNPFVPDHVMLWSPTAVYTLPPATSTAPGSDAGVPPSPPLLIYSLSGGQSIVVHGPPLAASATVPQAAEPTAAAAAGHRQPSGSSSGLLASMLPVTFAGASSRQPAAAAAPPVPVAVASLAAGGEGAEPTLIGVYLWPHRRNLLVLLLSRQLLVLDLSVHRPLGSLALDRARPGFQRLMFCVHEPDELLALHDDGCLSSWRWTTSVDEGGGGLLGSFELLSYSDPVRLSNKQQQQGKRTKGIALCAAVNGKVCGRDLLVAGQSLDGTLWLFKYEPGESLVQQQSEAQQDSTSFDAGQPFLLGPPFKSAPRASGCEARWRLQGMLESVGSPISSLCVSSFASSPGDLRDRFLVAVGTYHGSVKILSMLDWQMRAEFALWDQAVRGLRWVSATSFLAYLVDEEKPTPSKDQTEYTNRVALVNLHTGKQVDVRRVRGPETTFIRGLRVSHSGRYLVVLLKDRPFELWDLRPAPAGSPPQFIRAMKPFVHITALEWGGWSGSNGSAGFKTASKEGTMRDHAGELATSADAAEQFVFALPDGSLRYYTVSDSNVAATHEIHSELGVGIVASLAWKNDHLVSGDTLGSIHAFNVTTGKTVVFPTQKGLVRRIRFAPDTKHTYIMVLFNEGEFGIWDLDHGQRVTLVRVQFFVASFLPISLSKTANPTTDVMWLRMSN